MHGAPFPWDTEHRFIRDCERVVRGGGHIVIVGTMPNWQPLHARSDGATFDRDPEVFEAMDNLRQMGFTTRDFKVDMDYGTVQEALETFGFIYGPDAIDYILDNQTSHQEWGLRVYARTV